MFCEPLNRKGTMTWSPPLDGRSFLALAAALAALVFIAFRFAPAAGARRGTLVALRAAAVGVLVLILLNPLRVRQEKRAGPPPTAVFLLDESRSMSLEAPTSRAQAVDQLIRRCEHLLPPDRRPRIQKYRFGR